MAWPKYFLKATDIRIAKGLVMAYQTQDTGGEFFANEV